MNRPCAPQFFCPAAREALGGEGEDLLDEAKEHNSLKELIGHIEGASPEDDLFDVHVKVLSEYVKHHVKEKEGALFPKLRQSEMDLKGIGEQLAARKKELMSTMTAEA